MNKSKLYMILSIILISVLILCAIYYNYLETLDYDTHIKEITTETQLIDYNTDHNQALDVSEYAKEKGLKIPKILINFDTHSDIFINFPVLSWPDEAAVENWINEYIAKNPDVDEIYWVMPEEESYNIILQTQMAEDELKFIKLGVPLYGNIIDKSFPLNKFLFGKINKKPFVQEFLIDPITGKMNEYIKDNETSQSFIEPNTKYKKVKVMTCTAKSLPDFKNKDVFLSIDADYLSNSGFDTNENWKNDKTTPEIKRAVYKLLKTINEKNIRASIISMSLSPQYLPQNDHQFITKFFNYIIDISGKKDEIHSYKRKYEIDYNNLKPYQINDNYK